jgi:putative transposase
LYIFFLPPYSPQLNDIEGEWLPIKRHGMQGRSYEMGYELGVAVIEAIDGRYRHQGYACERYLFN